MIINRDFKFLDILVIKYICKKKLQMNEKKTTKENMNETQQHKKKCNSIRQLWVKCT